MIYIAASNSPDRLKQRADIVCKGPMADRELQAAADQAWEDKDELCVFPGRYNILQTLQTKCAIRCQGDVWFVGVGEEGEWMVIHEGVSGRADPQGITNLHLNGKHKMKGILIRDVHRSIISGVYCLGTKGGGLRAEQGYCLFIHNYTCRYGGTPALEMRGSGSVLDGFCATRLKGDAPVIDAQGTIDLRQLVVEDCATGDSPAIWIHGSRGALLSGLHSEDLKASAIVYISGTFGVQVERLSCWQEPKLAIPIVVSVEKSRAVKVSQVCAWNTKVAIVKIDAESGDAGCVADRATIREGYGNKHSGVQPLHLINYAGYGKPFLCSKIES